MFPHLKNKVIRKDSKGWILFRSKREKVSESQHLPLEKLKLSSNGNENWKGFRTFVLFVPAASCWPVGKAQEPFISPDTRISLFKRHLDSPNSVNRPVLRKELISAPARGQEQEQNGGGLAAARGRLLGIFGSVSICSTYQRSWCRRNHLCKFWCIYHIFFQLWYTFLPTAPPPVFISKYFPYECVSYCFLLVITSFYLVNLMSHSYVGFSLKCSGQVHWLQ